MIIYEVYNKVSTALFEGKQDAEAYLSKYGTAASGLRISELYVCDDTSQNNKPSESEREREMGNE